MTANSKLDRRGFVAALGATALAGCGTTKASQVRILSGSAAGSASASIARLFARHLAREGVTAVVENLPRAGGKLAAQQLQDAPRDGSVVSIIPTGLLYAQLLGETDGRWDLAGFEWIGSFSSDRRVLLVNRQSGITSFAELLTRPKPLIVAATTAASPSRYEPLIIQHITGARFEVIPGFVGGGRNLALVSGEAEGVVSALDGVTSLLDMPGMRIILRLNDLPISTATAGADKAPLLRDVAHGPDTETLLDLLSTHARLGRIIALPPRTPPEIILSWRERFGRVVADPGFRKEAAAAGYDMEPSSGPVVANMLKQTLTNDRSRVEAALRRAIDA